MKPRMMLVVVAVLTLGSLAAPAAAMYHPRLGRFVSRDPIGYADGMGLYEYGRGQPTQALDPSGKRCGECAPPYDPQRNKYYVTLLRLVVVPPGVSPDMEVGRKMALDAAEALNDWVGVHGPQGSGSDQEMKDARRASDDAIKYTKIAWAGCDMYVQFKWKSCVPCKCGWFVPNDVQCHEWKWSVPKRSGLRRWHQCTLGTLPAEAAPFFQETGKVNVRGAGPYAKAGTYASDRHAKAYAKACVEQAKQIEESRPLTAQELSEIPQATCMAPTTKE